MLVLGDDVWHRKCYSRVIAVVRILCVIQRLALRFERRWLCAWYQWTCSFQPELGFWEKTPEKDSPSGLQYLKFWNAFVWGICVAFIGLPFRAGNEVGNIFILCQCIWNASHPNIWKWLDPVNRRNDQQNASTPCFRSSQNEPRKWKEGDRERNKRCRMD